MTTFLTFSLFFVVKVHGLQNSARFFVTCLERPVISHEGVGFLLSPKRRGTPS